jgi:hypothetical protein
MFPGEPTERCEPQNEKDHRGKPRRPRTLAQTEGENLDPQDHVMPVSSREPRLSPKALTADSTETRFMRMGPVLVNAILRSVGTDLGSRDRGSTPSVGARAFKSNVRISGVLPRTAYDPLPPFSCKAGGRLAVQEGYFLASDPEPPAGVRSRPRLEGRRTSSPTNSEIRKCDHSKTRRPNFGDRSKQYRPNRCCGRSCRRPGTQGLVAGPVFGEVAERTPSYRSELMGRVLPRKRAQPLTHPETPRVSPDGLAGCNLPRLSQSVMTAKKGRRCACSTLAS